MLKGFKENTKLTLEHAHEVQQREAIPLAEQAAVPDGWCNVFIFFNLEAAFDEGHAIIGLGPVDGAIETYSFYRHSNKVKAPALMACLREPTTFAAIEAASGWIQHGNPGNYWNEHMNAALALAVPPAVCEAMRNHAESVTASPGEYDLFTRNCLHFIESCLAAGGVHLVTKSGRPLHTIIPKDAFKEARDVEGAGAVRYAAWKYWFPLSPTPENNLRSIPDEV